MKFLFKRELFSLFVAGAMGRASATMRLRFAALGSRNCLIVREQSSNRAHRQEKPVASLRKLDEMEVVIEAHRFVIDRIDDEERSGYVLRGMRVTPMQRVDKEELADARTVSPNIDRKSPEECGRQKRVARQPFQDCLGQSARINAEARQRAIATDRALVRLLHGNERHCNVTPRVLTGLLLQVAIERLLAAGKRCAVVVRCQLLDRPGCQFGSITGLSRPCSVVPPRAIAALGLEG
jgi:hypothetical protein